MTVVFGLHGNETMCVHACQIRKWCPTQQIAAMQCCEQFIDQGEFEVMKMLSGCRAVCCDEYQFHSMSI